MKIEFWESSNGKSPVIKWLKSLDGTVRKTVLDMFTKLEKQGTSLQMPAVRWDLQPGLHELRTKRHGGIRVYFCFVDKNTVALLLAGGNKGTQNSDIELALKRMKEV